ncbi:GDP-fucose protein O-fucosyltransferase 2-like isoform X2 [Liolophura sinensis]|uniref:GDP-fucose protein O-fucosyltransferase 2-like isoform X2 n=1 Tax=Liolophura sinensis TaxID=3198878 RepID=UPI003157F8DB
MLAKCHDALDKRVFLPEGQSVAFGEAKPTRFLLYDVNPGEGFNLRRDVYMRIANLVKFLNEEQSWTLVLPPWGNLYHWQTPGLKQTMLPWSTFFDISALNRHIPVIEFMDYLKVIGEPKIEQLYYLQPYEEGWKDGKWEERMDFRPCIGNPPYYQDEVDSMWYGWFFGYEDVYAEAFQCVSIQAHAGYLKSFLLHNTTARSVMIARAEAVLHDRHGNKMYWEARRSMVFAKHLKNLGDEFREKYLDSIDEKDKTVMEDDWTSVRKQHGDAVGGPYIGVHLRRKDYLRAHPDHVPSLKNAAKQIKNKLKEFKLNTVYIGTDAPKKEYEELKGYLSKYKVYRFEPTEEQLEKYKDGGVAIIDQWINAHSRYFLGSYVSTVSLRTQEEREILGFKTEMTFNCLCGDAEPNCTQPAMWPILYE